MTNDNEQAAILLWQAVYAKRSDVAADFLAQIQTERVTDTELLILAAYLRDEAQFKIDLLMDRSGKHALAEIQSILNPAPHAHPAVLTIARCLRRLGWLGKYIVALWLYSRVSTRSDLALTTPARWARLLLGRIGSALAMQILLLVRLPKRVSIHNSLAKRYAQAEATARPQRRFR